MQEPLRCGGTEKAWGIVSDMVDPKKPVRGDFLLSPVFLGPLVLLLFNDLFMKVRYPGLVSGILSDFAGMIFFPILLVALAEWVTGLLPGRRWANPWWFLASSVTIAGLFVAVKFTETGEDIYVWISAPTRLALGPFMNLQTAGVVSDPLDLLALTLIPVAFLFGRRWR